jgi:hypothetical protein
MWNRPHIFKTPYLKAQVPHDAPARNPHHAELPRHVLPRGDTSPPVLPPGAGGAFRGGDGMSARGLFRATGKMAKPVMADLIDGVAVYVDEVEREKDDFYPTPPEPTRAILFAEKARLADFASIWEPAAGDGAMANDIRAAGHDVHMSDLVDRDAGAELRSFYDFKAPLSPAIITNPPFCECNSGRWIRHALETLNVEYMALLLPLNWPGAESRSALWARHTPARVYLMRWRIDFTGKGAPPMLNAWFVWDKAADTGVTELRMLDRSDARQEVLL